MQPLCVADPENVFDHQEIWSFGQFLPKTVVFR
jgi:hypothetical protein